MKQESVANPHLHQRRCQIPKFKRLSHATFWAANCNGVFLFSADFACMEPLGMESWEITSEQITASSQYNPSWSPERSRLNYPENGWTPSDDTVREWIQVSGCSPTSTLVNNWRMPRSSSFLSPSSAFGFCCAVSALRLRCFQAETLFTSGLNIFQLICSTSLQITGALRKESQISWHAILTSRFSRDSLFSFLLFSF